MILEKSAAEKGILQMEADMFYKTEHQFVFEAIVSVMARFKACDILLLAQEMMRLDTERTVAMNGAYFVTLLSSQVASVGNFDYHLMIVKQKYLMREFIRRSSEMIDIAYDESTDPEELITDLQKLNGFMMQQMYAQERTLSMKELIPQVFEKYYQRQTRSAGNELPGISSGIDKLDFLIGGWDQSTLNVIAARPGMGKTSFILHLALQAVRKEKKALIFSLEMDAVQIGGRILQGQSRVDAGEFRLGILDDTGIRTLETVSDSLVDLPLYINDTPLQSIAQIRNVALKMKNKTGLDILFIDYLQLIDMRHKNRNYNREQEVAAVTRELKILSKELEIPIILLSQLNRSNERRDNKRPLMSDLRDSGSIEQDADTVLMLYRPFYYSRHDDDKGKMLVDLVKNRNGNSSEVWIRHNDTMTEFWV